MCCLMGALQTAHKRLDVSILFSVCEETARYPSVVTFEPNLLESIRCAETTCAD